MTEWVLIVLLTSAYHSESGFSAKFKSWDACEMAVTQIKNNANAFAVCIPDPMPYQKRQK